MTPSLAHRLPASERKKYSLSMITGNMFLYFLYSLHTDASDSVMGTILSFLLLVSRRVM